MKTVIVLFLLILTGCAVVPGAPECKRVQYEREGTSFKFYCEGEAGVLGVPL